MAAASLILTNLNYFGILEQQKPLLPLLPWHPLLLPLHGGEGGVLPWRLPEPVLDGGEHNQQVHQDLLPGDKSHYLLSQKRGGERETREENCEEKKC